MQVIGKIGLMTEPLGKPIVTGQKSDLIECLIELDALQSVK